MKMNVYSKVFRDVTPLSYSEGAGIRLPPKRNCMSSRLGGSVT